MSTVRDLKDIIIYEDRSLLILKKPAGLAVESARVYEPDLASLLRAYCPGSSIVHRLDQPVEGLLAAAKNGKAAAALSAEIRDGRMKKKYLARVCGTIPKEEDTLTDYLIRDGRTNTSSVAENAAMQGAGPEKAKKAVLRYRKRSGDTVEVELVTGRHHQIRVQLAHAGMPILGDRKYGGDPWECLCLCAYSLSLFHPGNGKRMEFRTEPVGF